MGAWYCTVEDVSQAMDIKANAFTESRIGRVIESASRDIDSMCHRVFFPTVSTVYFNWPSWRRGPAHVLWLEEHELISVSSLSSGGTAISSGDYFLEPNGSGPPFNRIELDMSSSAAFGGGDTTQRDITVTGLFGYQHDVTAACATAEALDDSETGVDVSDVSGIGVGSIVLIGTEYMLVTGKSWVDCGLDIHASDSLTAAASDVGIKLTGTTAIPRPGEVILIDSERMLVVDVAADTLTVRRAWDGTVLASHSTGSSVYTQRTLEVTRGALGSIAETHLTAAVVYRFNVPGLIRDLAIAEAIVRFSQENAAYARSIGVGEGARMASLSALNDLRRHTISAYGRQARLA